MTIALWHRFLKIAVVAFFTAVFIDGAYVNAQEKERTNKKNPRKERPFPPPDGVWNIATIILGCPAGTQVSMSIYPAGDLEAYVEYGLTGNILANKTDIRKFKGKSATTLTLTGLTENSDYSYKLCYRNAGESEFQSSPLYRFHTQRTPGSAFSFEIMGDSHPERSPKQNTPTLYAQTLTGIVRDRPDFFFCMGDDFSVDTLLEVNALSVEQVYLKQLPYLGLAAHSSGLFLVNGNHEQAALCNLDGTPDNVAVWAQNNRNRLYPQPSPDGFYTGDPEKNKYIGLLHDYYAWTWGDALFVVIDPYWHSKDPVDNVFRGEKNAVTYGI